jgi:hypothetical protein
MYWLQRRKIQEGRGYSTALKKLKDFAKTLYDFFRDNVDW